MSDKTVTRTFIDEFYSLFSRWEDHYFVGSMEHIRIIMQLKLNRYIQKGYINKAFKIFIGANLVTKTNKTVLTEPLIGRRKFKPFMQQVYKKIEVDNIDEKLSNLEMVFQDFWNSTSELTKEEDINKLMEVARKKGEYLSVMGFRFLSVFDENLKTDLLYDYPRHEVIDMINTIKAFDVNDYDRRRILQQINKERKEEADEKAWKKFLDRCFALLRKNNELMGLIQLEIEYNMRSIYSANGIEGLGSIMPTDIKWDYDFLKLESDKFCLKFIIGNFIINCKDNRIGITDHTLIIWFPVNKELVDDLQELAYYKDFFMSQISK